MLLTNGNFFQKMIRQYIFLGNFVIMERVMIWTTI